MKEQAPEEKADADPTSDEGADTMRSTATTESMPKMDIDSARGGNVDTQDTVIDGASELTDDDSGAKTQPSTDPEGSIDVMPSALDESTLTNGEATDELETKQEGEKPMFPEAIDHGEHPESTDDLPSPQPQTETLQAQLYSQAPYPQAQAYPPSNTPNPSQIQASAQAGTQASYAQSQPQLPYPQQAQQQPQLPYPQQAQQQPPYSQQQSQATVQYAQPYPQQQASYTQVQVYTNAQPTGGGPMKSKITAGLLAIFLGSLGVHKFYLGHTGAGILILLLNLFLWWTFIVPTIIELVCFIEAIIYFTKSDEEFQRDCVRG